MTLTEQLIDAGIPVFDPMTPEYREAWRDNVRQRVKQEVVAARFMQPPQPGTLPRPVADGCAYDPNPPSPDEVREAYQFKYGI